MCKYYMGLPDVHTSILIVVAADDRPQTLQELLAEVYARVIDVGTSVLVVDQML